MLKYFNCPDGNTVEVDYCLHHCDHQCMTLPTRLFVSKTRKQDGVHFSITQLTNPTCHEYLKITSPETVNPMGMMQAGMGTNNHALLEGNIPNGYIGEVRLESPDGLISGQFDLVDLKRKTLFDYKWVSAYSLAMMLGYERKGYWHEFTRGKKKGQKEWRYKFQPGGKPDYHTYDMQQNAYRILLKQHGIQIDHMFLQATAKESDAMLKSLGLDRRVYLIELPKYDDDKVIEYFHKKYNALRDAIKTQTIPPKCEDTWNDRRCEAYCSINKYCPYYKKE